MGCSWGTVLSGIIRLHRRICIAELMTCLTSRFFFFTFLDCDHKKYRKKLRKVEKYF